MRKNKKYSIAHSVISEWRDLGFYYDFNEGINQWQFYGSKKGLQSFVNLINDYIQDERNNTLFKHEHYGPYMYLKIITLENEAIIYEDAIGGSISDLSKLKDIISYKITNTNTGQTFSIHNDYGKNNSANTKFFVMEDTFDPASMDDYYKMLKLRNKKKWRIFRKI